MAEQFGAHDTITQRLARHRDERATYRRLLRIADPAPTTSIDMADWYFGLPPPDDDGETALDILQRVLGAYSVPT